jgi:hypothetical protein
MKSLLRLSLFLFTAVLVRADLVLEQKIDSQFVKGNSVTKIKGDKARMDIPSPIGGNMTMIMDLKADQMAMLIHAQKMVMKMKMADAKKLTEEKQKASGVDITKIEQPKATGQKEKVGDWNCEIYEVNSGGMTGKMWVSKDFPNYKAVMEQINKVNAAASTGMGMDPSKFQMDGMTVKTEMSVLGGKMTTTLVKVTEESVPDSEFEVPAGYNEMKLPGSEK